MGRYVTPTLEQISAWTTWVAERPPTIRAVAETVDPWTLYRLTTTNHHVTLAEFYEEEDGRVTLRVNITAEFNKNMLHERTVFGINPDHLVECDVPSYEERATNLRAGPVLSDERVEELIDDLRVLVRPDLWVLNDDGIAVRK